MSAPQRCRSRSSPTFEPTVVTTFRSFSCMKSVQAVAQFQVIPTVARGQCGATRSYPDRRSRTEVWIQPHAGRHDGRANAVGSFAAQSVGDCAEGELHLPRLPIAPEQSVVQTGNGPVPITQAFAAFCGLVLTGRHSSAVSNASNTRPAYNGTKLLWVNPAWPSSNTVVATPITEPICRVA